MSENSKSIEEMEHELFLARQRIVAGKENAIFDEINVRQKVMSRAVADIQAIDEDIGESTNLFLFRLTDAETEQ